MATKKSSVPTADTIDSILKARQTTHGTFAVHAAIAQALKHAMRFDSEDQLRESWLALDDDMAEALEMNQHKVARILAGDPTVIDHWDDICGYSKLVADRLRKAAK
jgi:hypothetical protein